MRREGWTCSAMLPDILPRTWHGPWWRLGMSSVGGNTWSSIHWAGSILELTRARRPMKQATQQPKFTWMCSVSAADYTGTEPAVHRAPSHLHVFILAFGPTAKLHVIIGTKTSKILLSAAFNWARSHRSGKTILLCRALHELCSVALAF